MSNPGNKKSTTPTVSSKKRPPAPRQNAMATRTSRSRESDGTSAWTGWVGLFGNRSCGVANCRHTPFLRATFSVSRMSSTLPLSTAESSNALSASGLSLMRLLLISATSSIAVCPPSWASRFERRETSTALYFSPSGSAPSACSNVVPAAASMPAGFFSSSPSCSADGCARRVAAMLVASAPNVAGSEVRSVLPGLRGTYAVASLARRNNASDFNRRNASPSPTGLPDLGPSSNCLLGD
mmetsp:Transcript_60052/g.113196  ORF Transcript_60052/g.113196 Transcript_60052/m.113196 type:complete len:239 (-) Transcript_60052:117-833(-)